MCISNCSERLSWTNARLESQVDVWFSDSRSKFRKIISFNDFWLFLLFPSVDRSTRHTTPTVPSQSDFIRSHIVNSHGVGVSAESPRAEEPLEPSHFYDVTSWTLFFFLLCNFYQFKWFIRSFGISFARFSIPIPIFIPIHWPFSFLKINVLCTAQVEFIFFFANNCSPASETWGEIRKIP